MKRVFVFIVLAMVVIGSCTAQSATNEAQSATSEAQSATKEAQKLVGTWVAEVYGPTFVFNADGTGTFTNSSIPENFFWGVSTSGVLFITNLGEGNFFLSPDGGRMIWRNTVYQKR